MTPTQVTIRFPAEIGRAWTFTPVGAVPHAGAIRPRRFAFAPDALEAADGTFDVALLATDQAGTEWAWQVRDPDNRRRTVIVPSGELVVDYADLVDAGAPGQAPPPAEPTTTAETPGGFEQAPAWVLDALRDMARRLAHLESAAGAPDGSTPIDPADVDTYLAGFTGDYITDYL